MSVNFLNLLRESGNFMQNQRQFTLFGLLLLFALQLATAYLFPPVQLSAPAENIQPDQLALSANFSSLVASALVNVFVNILLILNIKAINAGTFQHFFQPLGATFKALLPVILLSFIMVLPLSIGVSFGGVAAVAPSMAILILPLMISGIYLFVKFCLVIYVYLIEEPQKTIGETIKFTWGLSRGKMGVLLLFCILTYLLPMILGNIFAQLGGTVGLLLTQATSAFLSLYFVIFSFRFYQVYRNLNQQG